MEGEINLYFGKKVINKILVVLLISNPFVSGITAADESKAEEGRGSAEEKVIKSVQDYEQKTTLIVHYDEKDQKEKDWQIWLWNNQGVSGREITFQKTEKYGRFSKIAKIEVEDVQQELGLIIKNGSGWSGGKDGESDRYVKTETGVTEVWLEYGNEEILYEPPSGTPLPQFEQLEVTFHYHRDDRNYEGWFVHSWADGAIEPKTLLFSEGEMNELWQSTTAVFKAKDGEKLSSASFIIAKVENEIWQKDGTEEDRKIYLFSEDGKADVWLVGEDATNYRNPNFAEAEKRIKKAELNDFNAIYIELNRPVTLLDLSKDIEVLQEGKKMELGEVKGSSNENRQLIIKTKEDIPISKQIKVEIANFGEAVVDFGEIVRHPAFDQKFAYTGEEPLGAVYDSSGTTWRLWAPTAQQVNLILFESTDPNSSESRRISLELKEQGVWMGETKILSNTAYAYELTFANGKTTLSPDPYATAATANGNRSVVLDPKQMSPENWETSRMAPFSQNTDAVIYEMHIRDFSIANSETKHKGKFLGVIENGTKTVEGYATGIDYLKELGITHVQILPMYDYASLDEIQHQNQSEVLGELPYNWGYDPKNYNVPEGSYSTDPLDPATRILEMKQMIQGLHENGLRVIMDVVYNHVYDMGSHAFEKTVPGYYFRYNEDGSLANGTGVGNDTASDRAMMKKFIVDSVVYWAKEYHIDGFRFDLMGIHDVDTMNAVREALNDIDPSIIVLGEGWDLGTPLAAEKKANQKNASKMLGVAHFNDSIRDGIKGSTWGGQEAEPGFANGAQGKETLIANNLLAGSLRDSGKGVYDFARPDQVIQYVEAHDNLTLWDKLAHSNPTDNEETKKQIHQLATSMVILSQGVPFIHAGQEFFRTKNGDENSYESADEVNLLDWDRYSENYNEVSKVKELLALRRSEPLFRMNDYQEINQKMTIIHDKNQLVAYHLGDGSKNYIVAFNASRQEQLVTIPEGMYVEKFGETPTKLSSSVNQVIVPPLSTLVLLAETQGEEIPIESLKLNVKALEIVKKGKQLKVLAEIMPENATEKWYWESANSAIASVSEDGIVTGNSNGTTKITAVTTNGKQKSFTIRVSN